MNSEIETTIAKKLYGHSEQSWKRASGETHKHYLDLAKFQIDLVTRELAKEKKDETDLTAVFREEIEGKNSEIENLNASLEKLKSESEASIAELVIKVNNLTAEIEELKELNSALMDKNDKITIQLKEELNKAVLMANSQAENKNKNNK